ncbi:MAG TPA: hypothetical protein VF844_17730 [Ktedonobacteraceae bacterium]
MLHNNLYGIKGSPAAAPSTASAFRLFSSLMSFPPALLQQLMGFSRG